MKYRQQIAQNTTDFMSWAFDMTPTEREFDLVNKTIKIICEVFIPLFEILVEVFTPLWEWLERLD